ncbi:MAG: component of the polarisome [Thelocarpon impressellum]|nr:MAG: component of the polarisome [Thelocarpon impressellum]
MSARPPALSPESVGGGSEWSGISGYQNRPQPQQSDPSYSPGPAYNRGALATPPISSGSAGAMNGGPPNGTVRVPNSPGDPSPPSSIARSSNGTGLYASSDSGQSRKASILEESLAEHYVALKRFLAASLRDEKGNPRPNRARDKLLRLSAVQFQELSTDVFDELLRRQSSASQRRNGPGGSPLEGPPPYLMPKTTFHPKRNQARQKLSTLPPPRFRDLATDVFFELERRFPKFIGGDIDRVGSPASSFRGGLGRNGPPTAGPGGPPPGARGPPPRGPGPPGRNGPPQYSSLGSRAPSNDYGRPLPKTFQSNTIIPNKSTMVEDDDDQEDDDPYGLSPRQGTNRRDTARSAGSVERDKKLIAEFQAEADGLQVKVTDLEARLREREEEIARIQSSEGERGSAADSERQEWAELRADLEDKLAEAQRLHDSLQSALKSSQADNRDMERDLNTALDQARRPPGDDGGEWKDRYENLSRTHEDLQDELREQQQVTEEVRREAADFLREMKSLSDRSDESWQREERLAAQVAKLEAEAKDWKNRYTRAKTQLRNARSSSIGPTMDLQNAGQHVKDGGLTRADGLVKDVHVTQFQISIDELLHLARKAEPSAVLDHMKVVVRAVKLITLDLGGEALGDGDLDPQRRKLKLRVSATANNLITAAKNFSSSNGLSPVSLLDAAASHLAAAMVELVRAVKIRPTPPGELENDEDLNGSMPLDGSPDYFPVRNGSLDGESVYSTLSTPAGDPLARQRGPSKDSWQSPYGAPPSGKGQETAASFGLGLRMQDEDIEDLKIFLEDQTERLVGSIQSLVGSIRADEGMMQISDYIGDIATVVGRVVSSTEATINRTGSLALRDRGEPILDNLSGCRARLLNASAEGERLRDPGQLKDLTKLLPPLAFEIARETKELVQRIDQLGSEGADAESFA